MGKESLTCLNQQLLKVEITSVRAVEIIQALCTVEGSAECAQKFNHPRLDLQNPTGNLLDDCRNALFVDRVLIGFETKTIPNLKRRKESLGTKITVLSKEKQELERTVEDLDRSAIMFANMIGEKKNVALARLQEINGDTASFSGNGHNISKIPQKELVIEEDLPDFILERKSEHLAELLCPDGQKIAIEEEERIPLLQVLVDRTNDNKTISDEELSELVHGNRATLEGLQEVLKPHGWVIETTKKESNGEPKEHFLSDIPLEKFKNGRSKGFLVMRSNFGINGKT